MKLLLTFLFLWGLCVSGSAERSESFSGLRSKEDFLILSNLIKKASQQVRPATICVKIGEGTGSGVIISADGLVLSAAHVTQESGKKLTAVMEDGTEYEMVGLGLDTTTDASMARIILPEGTPELPYVELSEDIQVGDYVFSLGHSGGIDVERGSVLRLGRIQGLEDSSSMVTDCVLIGGDSGGPLFNLRGELIGIHSRVGTVTSSNTHVPIAAFKKKWAELEEGKLMGNGTFADAGFPFLGMLLLQKEEKMEVVEVRDNPAIKLEVEEGDIIRTLNGKDVKSGRDLMEILTGLDPEQKEIELILEFQRGEEKRTVKHLYVND